MFNDFENHVSLSVMSFGRILVSGSNLGETLMATAVWPLENRQNTINKQAFSHLRLFSLVFDCFCTFFARFRSY